MADSDYTAERRKNNSKKLGQVVVRAWTDEDFKQRLMSDPDGVLRDHGVDVPQGVSVKVVEDTEDVTYLVLPTKPADVEVSDFQDNNTSWCWSYNAVGCF